jgi:23S rRNA (uracil1939-C5)-methyltransferase
METSASLSSLPKIAPRCSFFGRCGGCRTQDLAYDDQLALKRARVAAAVGRDLEILPSPDVWHYRNKMEYSFGEDWGEFRLGLKPRGRWHEVLDLTECHLLSPETAPLLIAVRAWAKERGVLPYNSRRHTGVLRHLVLREAKNRPERMVLLVTAPTELPKDELVSLIGKHYPATTILHGKNAKLSDTAYPDSIETWTGPGTITEELDFGDRKARFQISPLSFFQTNSKGAQVLYGRVRKWVREAAPKKLLDLYCGGGGIGLSVADLCGEVFGIEQNPSAIEDAVRNAALNACENARFMSGSVEKCLDELALYNADAVIVDPPRSGLHAKAVEALVQAKPKTLIYVSCNPDSLARDLKPLSEAFELVDAAAVDLFPHTDHVESLALLSAKL